MDDIFINTLYENYDILVNAGDKVNEHEDEYLEILESVKGSSGAKRLACQFITKFFKHFPTYHDKAIDGMLDLVEDEDINIRKQAIKHLPLICKDSKEYVPRITDILAQLLLITDPNELDTVSSSLITVCKIDAEGFIGGIFSQILSGEEAPRDRVIKFLVANIKTLSEDQWTKEVEECFLRNCRETVNECTSKEFLTLIKLASGLKISKTLSKQQVLVEMLTEFGKFDQEFNPDDLEKITLCIKAALPHFSQFVTSNSFLQYICTKVLPILNDINVVDNPNIKLDLIEALAEASNFVQPANTNHSIAIQSCQKIVFGKLLEIIPLPTFLEFNESDIDENTFELRHIECLMYTLHSFGKVNDEFFEKISELDMKSFKQRLQFLARGLQVIKTKHSEARQSEISDKNAVLSLTITNISMMIRDLFHPKPIFKCKVNIKRKSEKPQTPMLSKKDNTVTNSKDTTKRKAITAPEGSQTKSRKEGRNFYAPPRGKFSSNFKSYGSSYERGRGRGRGNFRNR